MFQSSFLKHVKNLNTPKYVVGDTLYLNLNQHPTFKVLSKSREHPSIIAIRCSHHQTGPFSCIHKITDFKGTSASAVDPQYFKDKDTE